MSDKIEVLGATIIRRKGHWVDEIIIHTNTLDPNWKGPPGTQSPFHLSMRYFTSNGAAENNITNSYGNIPMTLLEF